MIGVWRVMAVLLGPVVGSFIGLASIRLPAGRPIILGRSVCHGCGRTLGVFDLAPILSYVVLKGRCRTCDTHIPRRYPLIELACLGVGVTAAFFHGGPLALIGALFGWGLLLAAVLDMEHYWLPDIVTLPLGALGLLAAFVVPGLDGMAAVIGAASGFCSLWLIAFAYRRLRGIDGLGSGDPRLFGAIGAWVGWAGLPKVLIWACAFGLVIVGIAIAVGSGSDRERRLPFGVFLAAGGWAVWLFGPFGF